MKTKISIAAVLVVTVLFLAGCQSSTGGTEIHKDSGNQASAVKQLTKEEARDVALKDAGFAANNVTNLHIQLDEDDGVIYYEVDFRQGDYEYDYEVDAATGKIIGFDKDQEVVSVPAEPQPEATKPAETKAITADEAKKIALDHAGLKESDVKRLTVKKDTDDGVVHYDVEFFKGDYEYDYEVNATTGKITDYDKEKEAVKASSTTASTTKPAATKTISKSKAQSIALDHAKLKKSDVTGLRVSLDKDDGRTYYEVDFRKGNVEYDYEIDAVTGKVVEWDKDVDD